MGADRRRGSGFEATIGLRVRDGNSAQLARTFVNTGGTGVLGNFQAAVDLPGVPETADGFVEVFDAGGADVPANRYLRIFNANRNQVSDPNLIFPGQQLRVPLGDQI